MNENGVRDPPNATSRKRTIGLVVVLCVAVVGSVAWSCALRAPSVPPVPIERKEMAQRPRPPEPEILRVPPPEMRSVVREEALLKPDRRFVLAFEDVAALEGSRPEGGARVSPRNRRWTIDAGSGIRAELSDIPGFFETLEALRSAAAARIPARGKKLPVGDALRLRGLAGDPFEDHAMSALREVDALWAAGFDRIELLDLASLAFVTIQLRTIDPLEMGDVVGGRAFAILALAEAAAKTKFPAREALLAHALGYPGEARQAARDLPGSEQIRLFFLAAGDEMKAVAESPGAPPVVRYLYALQLAPKSNVADVVEWLKKHGVKPDEDLASMSAALRAKDSFDHVPQIYSTLLMVGWMEAGGQKEKPGSGLLASFEHLLAARKPEKGVLFDDAVAVARTRTDFYGGLFGIGSFYLISLSSGPAAQQFIDYLKGAEPGPGADYRRWYGNLAAEKNGTIQADKLVDDLNLPSLGQGALRRTGERLSHALYATNPARPRAASTLERVLDSRPWNDFLFSSFCRDTLMHPTAAARYYRASMDRASQRAASPDSWVAYQAHDTAALRAVAANPDADGWTRIKSLEYLDELEALPKPEVEILVLGILDQDPPHATAMECLRRLRRNGSHEASARYLRKWLDAHPDEHVLTRALYAARLEYVFFLQGRFQEGWEAVEPYVSTGKGDALQAGAEALEGLGRHEEALAMSASSVERYPDNGWGRSLHAQILWRQGRYDEVPKTLLDPRHPLNPRDWGDTVADDFYDVFWKKDPLETRKAFDALLKAGVNPWFLFTFAEPFARHKQYDTAIEFLDTVCRAKNERIDGNLREYRIRIRRDGIGGANNWFSSEVAHHPSADWVAEKAFDVHEFELLWLMPDSDSVLRLRAQAEAFQGGPGEERKRALVEHFRDPKTPPMDALDGLFLIGLETEDHLFESATDAGRRCDVAFALGLKAVGEKRTEDACDWLRVCLRTGVSARPSYKAAVGLLNFWDVRRFGVRGGGDIP